MRTSNPKPSTIATRLARLGGVVAVALLAGISPVLAAPGDQVGSFDAVDSGIPACANSTGLAYDGANLILSCPGSNVLQLVLAAVPHTNNGPKAIAGVSSLGALSWDAGRTRLWACDITAQKVVLINVGALNVDGSQTPVDVSATGGCADGLAYDASDDTLWVSVFATSKVYHYKLDGSLINTFDTNALAAFEAAGYPNRGVALACGQLYISNDEGGEVFKVPKDFSVSASFGSPTPYAIVTGMARDPNTFKVSLGVDVLWVLDSFFDPLSEDPTRLIYALELSPCNPPICTAAKADPEALWPPNHKFVPISVVGVTNSDGSSPVITATSIRQDEIVNGNGEGAGNTDPDGQLSPLAVRAERNGNVKTPGDGRVYHIGFTATNGDGDSCSGTVRVCVPHDQSKKKPVCVDGGPLYNSLVP